MRAARHLKGALLGIAALAAGIAGAEAQTYSYPAAGAPAGLAPPASIQQGRQGFYAPAPQAAPYAAQQPTYGAPGQFSPGEIVAVGHEFFGGAAQGLAQVIERAFQQYGQPNGYVLGQEAGGAIIGGLRYGEGQLQTLDRGAYPIYWQGPSLGYDFGADGARTMILLYNLPSVEAAYGRFGGVSGSVYLVGGVGMTALAAGPVVAVPIRAGVGARLGINVGYLKFTGRPTWNPF